MKRAKLEAVKRKVTGRKVKRLRSEGVVPANLFGKKIKSVSLQVDTSKFSDVYKEAGETGLVDLKIGTAVKPVLISDIQKHPVTDEILHVDFRQVDLKEKVEATVPVALIGESPAEKSQEGILVQMIDEIDVKALPTDLPEKFEVDISGLDKVDSIVTIDDIKYNKGKIEIEQAGSSIVVKIEPLQKEDEQQPQVVEEAEGAPVAEEAQVEEKKEESQEAPVKES